MDSVQIRRESRGGTVPLKKSEVELHRLTIVDICGRNTNFFARLTRSGLKTSRANEYEPPTYDAIRTRAYSLSYPVFSVFSQLSNTSSSGQMRQVSSTTIAVVRDARDRTRAVYRTMVPASVLR